MWEWGALTFHREARLPLELGRVAAELIVRAEDEGDFRCLCVSTSTVLVAAPAKGAGRE